MPERTIGEVFDSFAPFVSYVPDECRESFERPGTIQVNVGYKCNLACKHCHVNCSPKREEEMGRDVMQACLDVCANGGFKVFDITGGAPEMNPDLDWLIEQACAMDVDVIVRTNLCILLEPEYERFFDVYADHNVHLLASLPYYSARNCDKIRGDGTFMRNIDVIQRLNGLGYGVPGSGRVLTLVYGPAGPTLPPDAADLEAEYHRRLKEDFDVVFNDLVVMANMPCGRFAEALNRKDRLGNYVQKLVDAFNPETVPTMMCRDQINVDWQGRLFDCDFNQAMGVPMPSQETVFDWVDRPPHPRKIAFRGWCYACTAGSGSS